MMAYSKAFREGLEDAVEKARWRVVTHLKAHLTPHPEDSPATRGELSKMLVVLHDCIENFITEVVGYLEPELARAKAGGGAAAAKTVARARPTPKAPARAATGRKAVTARRRKR
jgi:hypothetical protein